MLQIGFDVGGSKIAVGAVDADKQIIARREVPFPTGQNYEEIVKLMVGLVQELDKEVGDPSVGFKSIGISIPGDIDKDGGTIINAYNLQFHNVPMREALQVYFPHTPVYLANDANAAALAELHAGAFRGCRTAVLLTLGTGVGGGVILGGKIFNGGLGHGVELGHMVVLHNGPLCTCGNRGCVEALCTATWLIQQGRKSIVEYPLSMIYTKAEGDMEQVDAKMVIDCAKEGDTVAKDIFDRYVDQLSSAIVSCAVLLDPEVIALGGGVSLAGDFLFEPVRELVRKKSFFCYSHKIVPAQLGNDAGIIGAALLCENDKRGG